MSVPLDPDLPAAMPTYEIDPPEGSASEFAEKLFDFAPGAYSTETTEGLQIVSETGTKRRVEFDPATGLLWMADWSELWAPRRDEPALPERGIARAAARKFFRDAGLLPGPAGFVRVASGDAMVTNTILSHFDPREEGREDIRLDVHVAFRLELHDGLSFPLFGEGAKLALTFGESAAGEPPRIIGCIAGVFGRVRRRPAAELIPHATARMERLPRLGATAADVETITSPRLAYEQLRLPNGKRLLIPVWLDHVRFHRAESLLRLPATAQARSALDTLYPPGGPHGETTNVIAVPAEIRAASEPSAFIGGIWGPLSSKDPEHREEVDRVDSELRRNSWQVVRYENDLARESQWTVESDSFVEQLDLAYFSGRAKDSGWIIPPPAGNPVDDSEGAAARWGTMQSNGQDVNSFLRWIVISGCGPLQDQATQKNQGDAFLRWNAAMAGLRGLLGFNATILTRAAMGPTFIRRVRQGHSIVHAWLRAARECHPLLEQVAGTAVDNVPSDGFSIWAAAVLAGDSAFDETLETRHNVPEAALSLGPVDRTGIWTPV
jgi:hypothetical protein